MGTVRYTTVNGEVLAEKRGGVRRQYVPDPLGSTVALLDNTQAKTDTFAYWPYGEEASRTGTTPTPLRYVGTLGYYRDSAVRSYVRARHLDTRAGRWESEDPAQETEHWYWYVGANPVSRTDPTGLGWLDCWRCGVCSPKVIREGVKCRKKPECAPSASDDRMGAPLDRIIKCINKALGNNYYQNCLKYCFICGKQRPGGPSRG